MLYLKACPRCTGDLVATQDEFGSYLYCAQCGNHLSGARLANLLLSGAMLNGTELKPSVSQTSETSGPSELEAVGERQPA